MSKMHTRVVRVIDLHNNRDVFQVYYKILTPATFETRIFEDMKYPAGKDFYIFDTYSSQEDAIRIAKHISDHGIDFRDGMLTIVADFPLAPEPTSGA